MLVWTVYIARMKLTHVTTTAWLLAALVVAPVGAATLEGQRFDDSTQLAGQTLQLNGLGVRAVFILKGYVAGLYLTAPANTAQAVMAAPGPKRLQLRMLLSAGPEDFNKALVSGLRKNATPAELVVLAERIAQLERTINDIGQTVADDVIDLDYVPTQGMTLSVNGQPKGSAIAGADFFEAVLGIFVGAKPVDLRLKNGLLGQ